MPRSSTHDLRRIVALHPQDSPWPDQEVSRVAFRLHALGATEYQTRCYLGALALRGVRRLTAYVDGIDDEGIDVALVEAERAETAWHDASQAAAGGLRRRGDIQMIRTPARWPWRTSTSQTIGGGVDAKV